MDAADIFARWICEQGSPPQLHEQMSAIPYRLGRAQP